MNGSYRGPLKAVIFDWAGTIIDHGSRAPMGVFVAAFAKFGIDLSVEEARGPMGLPKWDHIKAVATLPRVAEAWRQVHGRTLTDSDIDDIFAVFEPLNVEIVAGFADFIPGALETVETLRDRGLAIGSTTGYTRPIMAVLQPLAAAAGYVPDCVVCAGDLHAGRPTPLMMYQCFASLGVWPPAACIKVDDTAPGIAEGLNAGTWTVGVSVSGNGFGLSAEETATLDLAEYTERRDAAAAALAEAGAHIVIDSVAELPEIVDRIAALVADGVGPRRLE